jgi:hypothetical protein
MIKKSKLFIETQGDPTKPDKHSGTSNRKYSFYHLIERKPVKICFLAIKCILEIKNGLNRALLCAQTEQNYKLLKQKIK